MDKQGIAKTTCEEFLLAEKRSNIENQILPSEVAIVDRLLSRSLELTDAYDDLYANLHHHPKALDAFLGALLSTAAFWNPKKMDEARQRRRHLDEVNRKISEHAAALAELLDERSDLHDVSGFISETHDHVCDVVEDAAKSNHLFKFYVQDRLKQLHCQFDMRYWPSLGEFASALALDAYNAKSAASDSLTHAGTAGQRASLTDFFNVFSTALRQNSKSSGGFLPQDLKLKDGTLSALANCALDLPPDEGIDGNYVKRWRQRLRQARASFV